MNLDCNVLRSREQTILLSGRKIRLLLFGPAAKIFTFYHIFGVFFSMIGFTKAFGSPFLLTKGGKVCRFYLLISSFLFCIYIWEVLFSTTLTPLPLDPTTATRSTHLTKPYTLWVHLTLMPLKHLALAINSVLIGLRSSNEIRVAITVDFFQANWVTLCYFFYKKKIKVLKQLFQLAAKGDAPTAFVFYKLVSLKYESWNLGRKKIPQSKYKNKLSMVVLRYGV